MSGQCDILTTKNTIKLHYEGFYYTKNKVTDTSFYWECDIRKQNNCPGRLISTCSSDNHLVKKLKNTTMNRMQQKLMC